MKPRAQTEHDEGMLEFLEDIIGTSRFKEPIEELAKKVEELNEGRGEKVGYPSSLASFPGLRTAFVAGSESTSP